MNKPKYNKEIIELPLQFIKKAAVFSFSVPNGGEGRWEALHVTNLSPVVVALTDSGEIILLRMFRFPVEDFVYELPGGSPNKGEALMDAVRRELLEETGYEIRGNLEALTECYLYNGKTNAKAAIFLATKCRKVKEPEHDAVERYVGVETLEVTVDEVIAQISSDEGFRYDPVIGHAVTCLLGRGLVKYNPK